jgi:hypothetical protein
VWVQAHVNGQWQNLDTAFADSAPGKAYAEPVQTVDAMIADWYQRVHIRVLTERLVDGQMRSSPVLDVVRPAVDLIGRDVYLVHTSASASNEQPGLSLAGSPRGDRWLPVLLIGDEREIGTAVDFSESEGDGGFFDALGGGSSSTFVAEWLEFEIVQPDGRREVTRRTIADRATQFWRATLPLEARTLAALGRDSQGPLATRAVHHIQFSGGPQNLGDYLASATLVATGGETLFGREALLIDQLFPMTIRDLASLVWTDDVIVPALNDVPGLRLFTDSPRIRIVTLAPGPENELAETLDLRRDGLRGVARAEADDSLVADRQVMFAALEGALEHEIVAQDVALLGGDAANVESTSAALTTDGVTTLSPDDLGRVASITARPDTAATLRAALGSGTVRKIVIPRAALAMPVAAWWEVSALGQVRAVFGPNLNAALGAAPVIPPAPQTFTIPPALTAREARLAQNRQNLRRFYRQLPQRRAAQARQRGLEYGLLVAMVVFSIAVVAYMAYDYHQRAVNLARSLEAIRAARR